MLFCPYSKSGWFTQREGTRKLKDSAFACKIFNLSRIPHLRYAVTSIQLLAFLFFSFLFLFGLFFSSSFFPFLSLNLFEMLEENLRCWLGMCK